MSKKLTLWLKAQDGGCHPLFHTDLEKVHSVTCLGINIDENLTWDDHVLSIMENMNDTRHVYKMSSMFS